MKRILTALTFIALSACSNIPYDDVKTGTYKGTVIVAWVNDGSTFLGDGKFVYIPTDFQFSTTLRGGRTKTFRPGMFFTDGGSVPKPAQLFKGFSPWGYGPAYIVHDWIFVARRCYRDGSATQDEQVVADMSFDDSSWVIASAIKTLIETRRVRDDDVAPRVVTGAVGGPLTRARWDAKGECQTYDRVPKALEAEIRRSLTAARAPATLRKAVPPPSDLTLQIVDVVSF